MNLASFSSSFGCCYSLMLALFRLATATLVVSPQLQKCSSFSWSWPLQIKFCLSDVWLPIEYDLWFKALPLMFLELRTQRPQVLQTIELKVSDAIILSNEECVERYPEKYRHAVPSDHKSWTDCSIKYSLYLVIKFVCYPIPPTVTKWMRVHL